MKKQDKVWLKIVKELNRINEETEHAAFYSYSGHVEYGRYGAHITPSKEDFQTKMLDACFNADDDIEIIKWYLARLKDIK